MQNKEKKRKETCSPKTQKQTNVHKINGKKRESAVAIFQQPNYMQFLFVFLFSN
jgi:hypothetical protein